ncbi:T9SS type A sorting domain-containing protein [Zunongwangia sp. H14]|uniref:T9SS type A sorting domain-containing protein n=1 Tax=Zunongwangia sp. H14 TaxID=3240792 RepID=UPI00356A7734
MKNIQILLLLLFSMKGLSQTNLSAQKKENDFLNAFTATGGDISGNNGSLSYSIGQIHYLSLSDSVTTIQEGVQQPFLENSNESPSIVEEENGQTKENPSKSKLKITVYPNPVTEFFIVDFSSLDESDFSYQLFDLQGKLLLQGKLDDLSTKIHPVNLQSSIYILKIYNHHLPVKSFKIIKK